MAFWLQSRAGSCVQNCVQYVPTVPHLAPVDLLYVHDLSLAEWLTPASQAGCHGFDPRLPLQQTLADSRRESGFTWRCWLWRTLISSGSGRFPDRPERLRAGPRGLAWARSQAVPSSSILPFCALHLRICRSCQFSICTSIPGSGQGPQRLAPVGDGRKGPMATTRQQR